MGAALGRSHACRHASSVARQTYLHADQGGGNTGTVPVGWDLVEQLGNAARQRSSATLAPPLRRPEHVNMPCQAVGKAGHGNHDRDVDLQGVLRMSERAKVRHRPVQADQARAAVDTSASPWAADRWRHHRLIWRNATPGKAPSLSDAVGALHRCNWIADRACRSAWPSKSPLGRTNLSPQQAATADQRTIGKPQQLSAFGATLPHDTANAPAGGIRSHLATPRQIRLRQRG